MIFLRPLNNEPSIVSTLNKDKMKQKNKQELSYFRLKLRSYMSEHHPERLNDTEFITARADMALTAYCDAVAQGFSHLEAESIASEVLYQWFALFQVRHACFCLGGRV